MNKYIYIYTFECIHIYAHTHKCINATMKLKIQIDTEGQGGVKSS